MRTLEDLQEEVTVIEPGMWENESSKLIPTWYAVANDEGIIAYFGREDDAYVFRSAYIANLLKIT